MTGPTARERRASLRRPPPLPPPLRWPSCSRGCRPPGWPALRYARRPTPTAGSAHGTSPPASAARCTAAAAPTAVRSYGRLATGEMQMPLKPCGQCVADRSHTQRENGHNAGLGTAHAVSRAVRSIPQALAMPAQLANASQFHIPIYAGLEVSSTSELRQQRDCR